MNQFISYFLLLLFCYSFSNAQWEVVGDPGFSDGLAYNITMQVDDSGTPYVAFADGANGQKPTVMKFDGTAWITVGSAGISASSALSPVLKLGEDGTPFIAFADAANGQRCSVMKYDGSNWEYVGAAGFTADLLSLLDLAISPDGMPYVAFADFTKGNKATVMKYDGNNWVTVGAAGFSSHDAGYTQIEVASDGTPYTAYLDVPFFTLTVKKFDGATWISVGNTSFVQDGTTPQLELDNNDVPFLAYLESGTIGVQKFSGTGSTGWELVGTTSVSGNPSYLSFDIKEDNNPCIAYSTQADSLRAGVKRFDGASWITLGPENITADTALWTVVALSNDGTPYIAFEDFEQEKKLTVMKFKDVSGVSSASNPYDFLRLFPNPANDFLQIKTEQEFSNEWLHFTISSMDGRRMLEKDVYGNSLLDITKLLPGIYCVRVTNANKEDVHHSLLVKK